MGLEEQLIEMIREEGKEEGREKGIEIGIKNTEEKLINDLIHGLEYTDEQMTNSFGFLKVRSEIFVKNSLGNKIISAPLVITINCRSLIYHVKNQRSVLF